MILKCNCLLTFLHSAKMTQWLTQTLSFLLAATIVQNKAVAEQGLEEGEEEENRGNGQVEDMELSWMRECFTALELHADEPDVQVCLTFGFRVLHGTPEDLNLFTVSGSCVLGHSQSVSARSCTEPSRRRAGWKVTQWHLHTCVHSRWICARTECNDGVWVFAPQDSCL